MKRLFVFIILATMLIACSKPEDSLNINVEQPKHPIIGKWQSEFSKTGPNFIIEFQENNLLRVENKNCSECIDFYNFKTSDEKSIEFDYAKNLAGEMMLMTVTVMPNNILKTQCKNKNKPNQMGLIDAPLLCMGDWKFQKIQ